MNELNESPRWKATKQAVIRLLPILFAGVKHWEVTVNGSGPNFWKVFDYITLGRWPFIVEATRGFKFSDADTVFDQILIKDVTPKER